MTAGRALLPGVSRAKERTEEIEIKIVGQVRFIRCPTAEADFAELLKANSVPSPEPAMGLVLRRLQATPHHGQHIW
jgi:hypothetical protein